MAGYRIRVRRRRAIVGLLVVVALGLAACGGGSPTAAKGRSTTTTARRSTSTTAPSTPTTAPVSTTTTTTAPAPAATAGAACTNGQVTVAVSPTAGGAAAGSIGLVLVLTNGSSSTCTLTGYPGVAGLDASGAQAVQASREAQGPLGGLETGSQTPPTVTLAPGGQASATVEGSDNPTGSGSATSCPTYPDLAVTLPATTQPVTVAADLPGAVRPGFPGCNGLQVTPVVPGTSGHTG